MAGHNKSRFVQDLLQRTEGKPPSFTVNLYPDHWSLNNGSRFHYHIPMAALLDDIRAQRIPVDFLEIFDSARVPFYDGCMVVQILDYRPQNAKDPVLEKPEQARVVLHPNSESLWADICSLNQRFGTRWTDLDALEVEARILLATSSPLCLDPDPHLMRIANHVMRASMPSAPSSLKRKAAAMEPEDNENDKARKIKIWQHMVTRPNRTAPSFQLFDAIQKAKQNRESQQSSSSEQQLSSQYNTNAEPSPVPPRPGTPVNGVQIQSPTDSQDDKKKSKKKKSETPQTPFATTTFIQANGTPTPVPPPQTIHQFVNTHPPPTTTASSPVPHNVQSPMQIPVYPSVQSVPDSIARVPTPSQPTGPRYTQSPHPPSRTPVPTPQIPQPQPQLQHIPLTPQSAKPPLPATVPNYPPQQAGQHFLPHQQPARNGVQKPPMAAALTAMAAHPPQGQSFTPYSQAQIYAFRNLQQQRLQKQNGRATPQTGVASPAQQPQVALSPVHQASSPLAASQQLTAATARSPMPHNASQPVQASIVQQQQHPQQQAQTQLQPSSMPRSPAQQAAQAHGQVPGYGQFNLRGMMPANPSAAHQALQAAVANATVSVPSGVVKTGTPSNPVAMDRHQHPQHPTHPQVRAQTPTQRPPSQPTQPQHSQQPPQTQGPVQPTQHPQQPLSQSQLQQMYPQMYGYQLPFNMQGAAGRIPQAYWSNMGISMQGVPNMANLAGIAGMQGMQGISGMQGIQGMGGMPPGMMANVQGMGRGIPMGAQQMATGGVGAGHVPGAGGQGKTAVKGGLPR
ncbi:hypothetical protein APHAL10511_005741 [Amanita phalloides]|nr:hypothetical protein APHAL10511_005741 [Amanita phalloides]